MTIPLNDILGISDPDKFKLHLGTTSNGYHPLDEFIKDPAEWQGWNEWKDPKRDDWTRPFILSFMEFYPKTDAWIFGGAFEVEQRLVDRYKLQKLGEFDKYTGRLIASFRRYQGLRLRAYYLENFIEQMNVLQILPEVYSGESFPGFEQIDHDFSTLETIIHNGRQDWQYPMQSVKGVYIITDKSNGKHYIGSAYGDAGIWSRWSDYINTGHGGNHELVNLIDQKGMAYARENFRFGILEVMVATTADETVQAREAHWKNVLQTREHGYNHT